MNKKFETMKITFINNELSENELNNLFLNDSFLSFELVSISAFVDTENNYSVEIRNQILIDSILKGKADVGIYKACQLPYPLPSEIEVISLIEGSGELEMPNENPLNGFIAIISAANRKDLKDAFSSYDVRQAYGSVTLVGFGPGSPDLLTIGGERVLKLADTIFYDDLLDKEYLQKYSAKLVNVGKRKGKHSAEQEIINRMVLDEARKSKNVVRLKGGDPMIFAHGGEELEYLKSNFVKVSVIPGVTTASAMSSLAQIPLTHRGISSSVAFVSGHAAQVQLPNTDTVVCYMAGCNITQIATNAIAEGRSPETPVLLVANVSLPEQLEFFYTLESLSRETKPFPTPIICIIGDVVGLRRYSEKELIKNLTSNFK